MMTITRGPRGLGQLIFLAVLFALVADATAQQPAELIIRNGLIVTAVGRTEGDLRIRNGTTETRMRICCRLARSISASS